jgi:CheY-like chemotaxis protein
MLNILIIDDNSGFIELLRELLGETKIVFNLVEANNPIEALEKFKKFNHNFDFILCDYYLPIQNGNDFLEIVKSHNKNITCFLMSADDGLDLRNFSFVDHFFTKENPEKIIKQLQLQYFLVS